ncbi:sugar phosphate isomerase/epimerase family protein [Pelagibacterium montanilacus]|uniref:sugar phosphate isomerase/epimerase family protein n=1 Tax=Pelagibacterium montanilacus TaxID=2185280 RepID=UPI000F8F0775|nr:sugar phosphate isomerase/epimerase [Pelagibacterium montanilacus]
MKIGCHCQTWGGVHGHPAGVGSIKDMVYRARPPFARATKEIRLVGFEGIEAFDGDVIEWHQARLDVAATGLTLSGVYTGGQFIYPDAWADERTKFERVIDAARALGARNLVVGGGAVRANGVGPDDCAMMADRLDELAGIADRAGLVAHFHPHPHPDGYNQDQVENILGRTAIGLCPDLGVLAKGGVEPVDFCRRYASRISYLHLKDSRNGQDIEVGQGTVDIEGVVSALVDAGFDGWVVAELDASESTPFASAQAMHRHIETRLIPIARGTRA